MAILDLPVEPHWSLTSPFREACDLPVPTVAICFILMVHLLLHFDIPAWMSWIFRFVTCYTCLAEIPKGGFRNSYLILWPSSKSPSYRFILEWFMWLCGLDGPNERRAATQYPFPHCCASPGALSNWVLTAGHPILLLIILPECEFSLHLSWQLFRGRICFFLSQGTQYMGSGDRNPLYLGYGWPPEGDFLL